MYICRRAVSGIPSDGNRVGRGTMFVARKSYYDEEYSVYLCGRASLLSLTVVHQFASYSVQRVFDAIAEFGCDGVGIRPDNGGKIKQNADTLLQCTLMETKRQAVESKGVVLVFRVIYLDWRQPKD